MSNEVIIDGVDVSECIEQGETVEGITCGCGQRLRLANRIITKHKLCKDNFNCYYKQLKRCEQKLEKIKELCQVPNEPYYNSECEFGKGRIDLGQEILEIIEGAKDS